MHYNITVRMVAAPTLEDEVFLKIDAPFKKEVLGVDSICKTMAESRGSWNLIGIDPGLGSGGIVGIDARGDGRVLFSRSLVPGAAITRKAKAEADALLEEWGGWGDRQYLQA